MFYYIILLYTSLRAEDPAPAVRLRAVEAAAEAAGSGSAEGVPALPVPLYAIAHVPFTPCATLHINHRPILTRSCTFLWATGERRRARPARSSGL